MKRTVPWAIFALYPLLIISAVNAFGDAITAYLSVGAAQSDFAAVLATYWWPLLFATVIVQVAFFVQSALRNRACQRWQRILWSGAILLVGPIVIPAYWWFNSERSTSASAPA